MKTHQGAEMDIAGNLRIVEWLKSELLTSIADFFRTVSGEDSENCDIRVPAADNLSDVILLGYLLARRLGIGYNAVEMKLQTKIKLGIIEGHHIEKNYGDLSELSKHFGTCRGRQTGL